MYAMDKESKQSVSRNIAIFVECIIGWFCKQQKTMLVMNDEADYFALELLTQDMVFYQKLLEKLGIEPMKSFLLRKFMEQIN